MACLPVTPYGVMDFVNAGSGNSLLPNGTKPLRWPMLLSSEILWHSPESYFTVNAQAIILCNKFENHTF